MTNPALSTNLDTSMEAVSAQDSSEALTDDIASLSTYSLAQGYEPQKDYFLKTSFDPGQPFASISTQSDGRDDNVDSLLLLPVPYDERDEIPHSHEKPKPQFNQNWQPDDWQLSASTHFLFTDNMAGFYNGGVYVTDIEKNEFGEFQIEAGGFATAWGSPPITLDWTFVRKRPTGDYVGEFESKGPSFNTGFSYQRQHFTDYGYRAVISGDQFAEVLDSAAGDVANDFNSGIPIPASDMEGAGYYLALQQWFNEKINNIPEIIKQGFTDYNPGDDYEIVDLTSDTYGVSSLKLDAEMCLEDSVWRYDRRVNAFHSGKICLEGSAIYFTGNHFSDNFYLGVGPYFEFTVLSYHQKPFHKPSYYDMDPAKEFIPPSLTVSSFVYANAQYFNGYRFDYGFDEDDRFVTANIGVGLRTTIPSFSKRKLSPPAF